MKGKTTMVITQATMLEAVQLWLDEHFHEPVPRATAIFQADSYENTFKIDLDPPVTSSGPDDCGVDAGVKIKV